MTAYSMKGCNMPSQQFVRIVIKLPEVAMYEGIGLGGVCSCGLHGCTPIKIVCDFHAQVFCFGDHFQDLSMEGVV